MDVKYIENHIIERIDAAKKRAQDIKKAVNLDSLESAELFLRYLISRHYNIPFFDDYFSKRTIDELFFEAELIVVETPKSREEYVKRVAEENKTEIDTIADEMEKEFNDSSPLDEELENDPFFKMAKKFAETGSFIDPNEVQEPEQEIEQQESTEEDEQDGWK